MISGEARWSGGHYGHCEREGFAFFFLDTKNPRIAEEIMNQGTVDHAPVHPQGVLRRVLY